MLSQGTDYRVLCLGAGVLLFEYFVARDDWSQFRGPLLNLSKKQGRLQPPPCLLPPLLPRLLPQPAPVRFCPLLTPSHRPLQRLQQPRARLDLVLPLPRLPLPLPPPVRRPLLLLLLLLLSLLRWPPWGDQELPRPRLGLPPPCRRSHGCRPWDLYHALPRQPTTSVKFVMSPRTLTTMRSWHAARARCGATLPVTVWKKHRQIGPASRVARLRRRHRPRPAAAWRAPIPGRASSPLQTGVGSTWRAPCGCRNRNSSTPIDGNRCASRMPGSLIRRVSR